MKYAPTIFREYDIRGIAEGWKELSPTLARDIGLSFAAVVREKFGAGSHTVALGRDCRETGKELAAALESGLLAGGLNVKRLGVCPTPLTYFALHHWDLAGAIMVTGSHNPSEFNGFKMCLGKDSFFGPAIQKLRERIESGEDGATSNVGQTQEQPVIPVYLAEIGKNLQPGMHRKKVVLDAGNGTAGNVAPQLFRAMGAEVVELYCELDGRFPNHHPDPTVVDNLKTLIETVKRERADFGLGFDGDSDRVGLVDEAGNVIFGDEILVILAREVLERKPGSTIMSEVKSSHRLYEDIRKRGGKAVMCKTGHSIIKTRMKEEKAELAGEMSGHIFFKDRFYGFDDGIYAAARIYEIASRTTKPFSSLLDGLPKSFSTPEIRIDCSETMKFDLVDRTKQKLSGLGARVIDIDGVRAEFSDGWGLLRASNTQAVLVMRFESESEKRLNEIRHTFEGALTAAAREMGHAPIDFR